MLCPDMPLGLVSHRCASHKHTFPIGMHLSQARISRRLIALEGYRKLVWEIFDFGPCEPYYHLRDGAGAWRRMSWHVKVQIYTSTLDPRPSTLDDALTSTFLRTETINAMKATIEFSPVIPLPVPFDVQKRIQELRGYLDPNNPDYQPEQQHTNIKAAIKLYENWENRRGAACLHKGWNGCPSKGDLQRRFLVLE
jgi:hypothetical protein